MPLESHRDDRDLRYLSGRRRAHPDRLRRQLRSYRPARHDADGTWRLARRHSAARRGAGRPVALRGPGPGGRRRRPHSGTFDRGRRGIRCGRPRGKFVAARRLNRDGGTGCGLRGCAAARRRADRLCAVVDPALVLGSGHVAGPSSSSRHGSCHATRLARAWSGACVCRSCPATCTKNLRPHRSR
jgi:hypothetical protein